MRIILPSFIASLLEGTVIGQPFGAIATNLAATPPMNSYTSAIPGNPVL